MTLFEEMLLIFLASIEVSQALKSTQLRGQWGDIEACLSHEKGEKSHRKYEVTWHETVAPKNPMGMQLLFKVSYGAVDDFFYRNGKVMDAATVLDLKKQLCQEA